MDAATFSREATACQRLLYHICWAMMHNEADCADAVQEALLRAWQRRESLRDPEAFRPWLCRITANVCKDMLRRQHRRQMVPLPENLAAAPYDEDGLALRQAMEQLSPQQRAAVALHYFDGLSVEEVSRALGIPKGTVKSRLLYARRNLGQLLSQEMEVSV